MTFGTPSGSDCNKSFFGFPIDAKCQAPSKTSSLVLLGGEMAGKLENRMEHGILTSKVSAVAEPAEIRDFRRKLVSLCARIYLN